MIDLHHASGGMAGPGPHSPITCHASLYLCGYDPIRSDLIRRYLSIIVIIRLFLFRIKKNTVVAYSISSISCMQLNIGLTF
jgi:hypothetical protein